MKKLLSYIAGIAALFVPAFAFADVAGNMSSYDLFSPPLGDKSINYLGQVFGTVGGVIHGTSGQLLSEVFRVFNYGMVVVASLILIYSIVRSIIDTATEGEFMGRNKNTAWLIVRAVTGIGILVPKYTGYSLIQVFIMWVAVQGIGLADNVWGRAIDYLANEGGSVYFEPASTLNSGMRDTLAFTGKVLDSEVCMYTLQDAARKDRDNALAKLKNDPTNPALQQQAKQLFPQYRSVWNASNETVVFGIPGSASAASACGTFSWRKTGSEAGTFTQYKKAGLEQLVVDLEPVAKSIASAATTPLTQQQTQSLQKRVVRDVLGATADYENILLPALNRAKQDVKQETKDSLKEAREHGWIVAGSYYWDLASINNKIDDTLKSYQPTADGGVDVSKLNSEQRAAIDVAQNQVKSYVDMKQLAEKLQLLQAALLPGMNPAYVATVLASVDPKMDPAAFSKNMASIGTTLNSGRELPAISTGNKTGIITGLTGLGASSVGAAVVSPGAGVGFVMMTAGMSSLVGTWMEVMNAPSDPLQMLQTLGKAMVGIAVLMWIGTAAAIGGISLALGWSSWLSSMPFAIESGLKIFTPVFIALVLTLFVNGMVLSVYVPLIPFFIFTFAAIGWLISIFEAVIAGPLVAAAVTHPEGHDLLGKAEQAVMLLMGVFLRPVVMVIGFLASMVICRVALRIVFSGFSHVVEAAGITMSGVNIFGTAGLMIILTTTCSTIITLVFTAGIVKSWETMWMWIGAHQPSNSVENALQEVKGGFHSGVQSGGELAGGMVKGSADHAAAKSEHKRNESRAKDLQNTIRGETK